MKRKAASQAISLSRTLKPKATTRMPTIPVEDVSVYNSDDGHTYLIVYPDQTVIDSKDVISTIENKKDYLMVGDYLSIQIQDILTAVHNCSAFHLNTSLSRNKPKQLNQFDSNDPKRPTNAFILFNNTFRKKVKSLFPNYTNSEISKFIGAMWKAVAKDVKEDYINQAIECRRLHKIKYPNFEYKLSRNTVQPFQMSPQEILSNDWENYFNWCIQNATTEATSGALNCDSHSQVQFIDTSLGQDFGVEFPSCQQDVGDWNEICDVISQFFPDESDQASYIDEQLWDILSNFTTPVNIDGQVAMGQNQ